MNHLRIKAARKVDRCLKKKVAWFHQFLILLVQSAIKLKRELISFLETILLIIFQIMIRKSMIIFLFQDFVVDFNQNILMESSKEM